MPTLDDLRQHLSDAPTTAPETRDRLERVHRRITVRRRRRTVGAGLAVVAVIAVGLVVAPRPLSTETSPPAGPSPSAALPEYHLGGHLIAQREASGPEPLRLSFTPTSRRLSFTVDCYVPDAEKGAGTMTTLTIGGSDLGGLSCSRNPELLGGSTFTPDPEAFRDLSPGAPTELQVDVAGDHPSWRILVGVYEEVPLAEYPFPAQPDPLPALEPNGNLSRAAHEHPVRLVTPDPQFPVDEIDTTYVEPNGSSTHELTLDRALTIDAQTAAPGALTFMVGGRTVYSLSSWDYEGSGFGATVSLRDLGIEPGATVQVTVVAERFPGESWAVLFSDEEVGGG